MSGSPSLLDVPSCPVCGCAENVQGKSTWIRECHTSWTCDFLNARSRIQHKNRMQRHVYQRDSHVRRSSMCVTVRKSLLRKIVSPPRVKSTLSFLKPAAVHLSSAASNVTVLDLNNDTYRHSAIAGPIDEAITCHRGINWK